MAVYFYGCITLDGYLAAKGHGLDWLYDTGSPEETSYDEFYSHMDVTLMVSAGRSRRSKNRGSSLCLSHHRNLCLYPQRAFLSGIYGSQWRSCGVCKRPGTGPQHLGGGRKYHSCPSAGPGYGGLSHRSGGLSAVRRGDPSVYAEGSHAPVPAGNRPAVRAVCGAGVWPEITGAVHLQLFSLRCTAEKDMLY